MKKKDFDELERLISQAIKTTHDLECKAWMGDIGNKIFPGDYQEYIDRDNKAKSELWEKFYRMRDGR